MRKLALLLALPFLGCQNYLFNQVCPESVRESSVTVPAATPTPADILFVVDNSGSMADEQENLAVNFDRFINQIAGAGDYRIAVVTTDQSTEAGDQGEEQGLVNSTFKPEYPNTLTSYDRSGCTYVSPRIDHGCFRGPDSTTRIIDSSNLDKATQINTFGQNVRVGSCGSGTEQGLKAMASALEQTRGNGCNAGFLRDGANLVIIFVSDEEDDDDTPIQQFVNDIKNFKSPSQIRVAAIVGSVDGTASACSISEGRQCGGFCQNMPRPGSQQACQGDANCPAGEYCVPGDNRCENEDLTYWDLGQSCASCSFYNTPDCCSATAGGRYISFARAMEQEIANADGTITVNNCMPAAEGERTACLVDTICQENFGDTLTKIARDLVLTDTYNLDPKPAYPQGISVRVKNGRFPPEGVKLEYGTDFEVSEDGGILRIISADKTPVEGEDIEINFVVEHENRVEEPRGACAVSGT